MEPSFLFPSSFISHIKEDRILNLYEPIGYVYSDTLQVQIPEEYEIEFLPGNAELVSVYGKYQVNYEKISDNHILISRQVQINKGNYQKETFKEIRSFLAKLNKKEKEKIILNLRKT